MPPSPLDALPWRHDLAALGAPFIAEVAAEPVTGAHLLHVDTTLAGELGLSPALTGSDDFLALMSGQRGLAGTAVASVYGGHQFGVWVPQLGDGRALLLGELPHADGRAWELQLKGAGRTPWSRFGDGRAVLRSSLREYLCSAAMHGLGIPTTRALCLVDSDTPVQRETRERAALVCRASPSHLRFGHFEYFAHRGDHAALRQLADWTMRRHWPELDGDAHRWLADVVRRTAELMAHWQCIGFCHGVMNTDNFSILGLSIDYGPFAFMDGFDARHISNQSDHEGRYAYHRQPAVGHWNCMRLLQACLPLLDADPDAALEQARALLDGYAEHYAATTLRLWRSKLGLLDEDARDAALIEALLHWMHAGRVDFTRCFRSLADVGAGAGAGRLSLLDEVVDPAGLKAWLGDYRARLATESREPAARAAAMRAVNPKYVLRNWIAQSLIERLEADPGDLAPLDQLMQVLARPYDEHPQAEHWAQPPADPAAQRPISCSS